VPQVGAGFILILISDREARAAAGAGKLLQRFGWSSHTWESVRDRQLFLRSYYVAIPTALRRRMARKIRTNPDLGRA